MKLVAEGKKDLAVKALDKAMAVMPKENVPYDVFVIRLCEAYYSAGANAKAAKYLKDMMNDCAAKYKYYSSFKSTNKKESVSEEVKENEQIMQYCQQVAEFNKDSVSSSQFKKQFENTVAGK
jgi:hypothetical protein